ncbi:YbaB/EbfC family nucleoid-associated protein [Aureimonas fodinaquatilis]|uniref:Nucleoid-associated protein FPY71_04400 n=1 Tax=Aureimonas fodinaquatilis TaxID=2565783 RepID=A0A5B0E0K2_9HYPH|nr:YbaB/EbfC family nucleoid-associated protein [Aureimonas fodinaquatilis]KAA0972343.1 YbaB/EbfC family nucleoid-associated protein [Aureimonas fodinaquatilis]
MKDLMGIMKQAKAMQEKMQNLQAEIELAEASGQAGGGLVSVSLRGQGDLVGISIDPSLMVADEKEILEDLIVAAYADGRRKLGQIIQEKTQELTAGMNLPDGLKLPF